MIDNELLTFDLDHATGAPTSHSLIVRDEETVLVCGRRSKNADSEWELRDYRVAAPGITIQGLSIEQTELALVLVDAFEADALTRSDRHRSRAPLPEGIPTAVVVDGTPATAAWLRVVQDRDREEIADLLDVGARTVREYLSRFRTRGDGLPDDLPAVGTILDEVPPRFDPERQQIVVGEGSA
jgi:hypothetical protein